MLLLPALYYILLLPAEPWLLVVFLQNESFTGVKKRLNVRLKNLINIRICGGAFGAKISKDIFLVVRNLMRVIEFNSSLSFGTGRGRVFGISSMI